MVSLTSKQLDIFNYVINKIESKNTLSACILGAPGTGKTTLIKEVISHFHNTHIRVIALAQTGVAAANICGSTIHSFFKFNIYEDVFETSNVIIGDKRVCIYNLHKTPQKRKEITSSKNDLNASNKKNLIIVDEISSCGIKLLTAIDKSLKAIFDSTEDFGGVHTIFTGDLLQLDPVSDIPLWRISHFPYRWDLFELKDSLRNDCKLFKLCNKIRDGDISAIYEIMTREDSSEEYTLKKDVDYLFTHRRDVYEFNNKNYKHLLEKNNKIGCGEIYLEDGMKVLFLSKYGEIPNGTIGTIQYINDINVTINTSYGQVVVNKSIIKVETDTYRPIISIYFGSTIHKLQGQTLHKVCVKIRHIFEYGLLNVLLSRIKKYENLKVEDISDDGIIFTQSVITDYQLKLKYVEHFKKHLGEKKTKVLLQPPFFFLSKNN